MNREGTAGVGESAASAVSRPGRKDAPLQVGGLVAWVLMAFAAAAIGGVASRNAPQFYTALAQPVWAPSPGVFGPVWTVLYLLNGIAAWLVWRARGLRGAPVALSLFIVQLVLNALWSWVFFVWQRGALAIAEIVLLDVLIVATLIAFWRVRPLAGALLIPYALWVAYATALTVTLWRMNPGVL